MPLEITFTNPKGTEITITAEDYQVTCTEDEQPQPTVPDTQDPAYWHDAIEMCWQRDSRFIHTHYHGSFTFGGAGCYVCSFVMLLRYLQSFVGSAYELESPVTVARRLGYHGVFYQGMFADREAAVKAYSGLLRGQSIRNWADALSDNDLEVLKQQVNKRPTIMSVDFNPRTTYHETHFVLALMYQDVEGEEDILIADPWTGKIEWLSESKYVPYGTERGKAMLRRWVYGLRIFYPQDGIINEG